MMKKKKEKKKKKKKKKLEMDWTQVIITDQYLSLNSNYNT
jgi:hypothetical protein